MSKVCMIVRYPDAVTDLVPLLNSVCGQDYRDVEVIVLSKDTVSVGETILPAGKRLEARGCRMLLADVREHGDHTILTALSSPANEYFCFPNPESILEPEFVSEMVGFLEGTPRYSAVRCNGVFVDELDPSFHIDQIIDVTRPHEGSILESLLVKETSINICSWMVRRTALIESAPGPISLDQSRWDWQFALPLARSNRVGFIDRNLFRMVHYSSGPMRKILTRYDERTRFEEALSAACLKSIDNLEASEDDKSKWRKMGRIASIKTRIDTDNTFRLWHNFTTYRDELSTIVEACGGGSSSLDIEADWLMGVDSIRIEHAIGSLTYHYSDLLLQVLMERIPAEMSRWVLAAGFRVFGAVSSGRRFCFYGGGAAARGILPSFLALGFRPQCIWDRAARPGQTLFGLPVTTPRFSAIPERERKNLEVIVAIGHRGAAEEVKQTLNDYGFHNVINISEIQGARMYFRDLIWEFVTANPAPERIGAKRLSHE